MGSFNTTCSLTGEIISHGTQAVMVLLTAKGNRNKSLGVHPWDMYAPSCVVFEGSYNGYGRLEDVKLFQSRNTVSQETLDKATQYVFNDLKNKTQADYDGYLEDAPKDISQLMQGDGWGFAKKDTTSALLKTLLDISKTLQKETGEAALETLNKYSQMFQKFTSIEEAETKLEELEKNAQIKMIPISFVFFEKKAYLKLVNGYGAVEGEANEDIYAQIIQKERTQGLPPQEGTRCVMLGEKNYAGSNYPAYTLGSNIKEEFKKVLDREQIKKLENLYVQDLTLVNDFFMMTGKSWVPTMTINEDIKYYGHNEALEFQAELLEKKTKKPKP